MQIINPKAGLIEVLEWTLLNSAVALVGYYFAAFTIDKPWMGRMRMQCMGFAWMVGGGLSWGLGRHVYWCMYRSGWAACACSAWASPGWWVAGNGVWGNESS